MDTEVTFRSEQRLTQEEFFDWVQQRPTRDTNRYELIHGRIVMSPGASFGHARWGSWLNHKLWEHVEADGLGLVLDTSAAYELPSGDTLEPDVSFISKARLAAAPEQDPNRFTRIVPDLVVEVLSPSTARRDRTEKKDIYAANGVREYWLVDGARREVTVFHLRGADYEAPVVIATGVIPSEVLPGLNLSAEDVFRD